MKKNNSALKAGFWYTFSNFLVKGIAFISMPLFTRLMSKSDIGLFSNITSWFTILSIVATLELYSSLSIARFDFKEDLNSYISSNLVLGTILTFIFYILFIIFHNLISKYLMIDFFTLNIMFIYLLFYPSVQMFQMKNQFIYNHRPIIFVSLLSAISSTALSLVLVIFYSNKLIGRTIGYFLPLIIIAIIIYFILLKDNKKISKKYWKYSLAISLPLVFHLLAGYLLNSADKIMITKLISPEANAMYSVSYTISMVASLLWSSLNNAWSPWAYDKMEKKQYNDLKEKSKPYTLFYVIIIFIMMLFAPELLLIMAGKKYLTAKYVIPPVMVGYIFQFVYSLYVNIEFYHKKQKNIALGTIIAAILNIILNAIFIPKVGYIAAAYTTLVGYMILLIIHFLFVKKLRCTYWYDTKFFINISIISIIFMFACNLLYKSNIIRYLLALIIIVFIVYFILNSKLIKIIRNKKITNKKI